MTEEERKDLLKELEDVSTGHFINYMAYRDSELVPVPPTPVEKRTLEVLGTLAKGMLVLLNEPKVN